MKKRIFPLLIVILVMFTMMPMTAGTVFADADTKPPVIDPAVSVDKQTVKAGETVTLSATVTDDKAVDGVYFYCWNEESKKILDGWAAYDQPDNKWKISFNITENTSPGLWRIEYISAYDTNSNGTSLYDVRYDPQGVDLSASDFTVVRTCHVTFDTRGGSKVTAQDVLPGENAVRPDDPTKGAGAWQGGGDFSGWYADEALTQEFNFNNPITEDTTVYAKWAYVFSVCSYDKTNNADYDGGKYMVLLHGATEDDLCYGGRNFTLYDGDAITLKAVPDTGYKFTGWFKGEYIGMVDDRHTQVSRPLDMSDPDNLLSSDPEYAFVIDKYTVICPVFEVCTDHQWSEEKIQKATPDAEGHIWRVCTICGAEETGMPIPKVSNISLEGTSFTYTGKAITPKVTVANAGEPLSADCYTVTYSNNTNVGTATVKITLKGNLYEGTKELTFTITKPAGGGGNGGNSGSGAKATKSINPMKVKAKTVKVKYSKLRNKKLIIKTNKAFTITDARGKVTFKVVKYDKIAKKKIKVSKAGKITVKKGLKKGTYKLKVNVTAAGNTNYEPLAKMVTVKIKVK